MMRMFCSGAWVFLFIQSIHCATYETFNDLHQQLLKGYNKQLRPVNESSDAVHLQMDLALTKVGDLESRDEMMVSWIEYSVTWQDQRMVWSELEYPGVDSIRVARTDVWTPDLEALALEDRELRGQHMLQISSGGMVQWKGSMLLKTSCPLRLQKFPFDSHVCSIVISTSIHTKEEVDITEVVYKGRTSHIWISGGWDITGVSVNRKTIFEGDSTRSYVSLDVEITRQSFFMIITFLAPMFTILGINLLVFLVKHQSGERISVAVTVFLSFTMFLSSLNDLLPRTSTSISLLSVVAYLQFQSSGGIVISTIISHCLYHSTNEGFFVRFWATLLRVKPNTIGNNDDKAQGDNQASGKEHQGIDKFKLVQRFDRVSFYFCIFGSCVYAAITFVVPLV